MPSQAKQVTLTLPRPHPAQRKIIEESARFNVLACGRRFGKTTLAQDRLTGPALEGAPVAWFSPTYKNLAEVWREFVELLQPVARRINVQEHRVELVTDGIIDFWSIEGIEGARGRKYRRAVFDEAAHAPGLDNAWNKVIRPALADLHGDAWFPSTPKGRNFYWRLFLRGQDPGYPDWASWQMPTYANPYIDPLEIDAARAELPEETFRQEFLAEFLDDAGGVFRRVREAIDIGRIANEPPSRHSTYGMGADLARVRDFTALVVLDQSGRQVYFDRFNRMSWERQIEEIARVSKTYNNAAVTVDSTGVGDPIFERLRNRGVSCFPYNLSHSSKEALIDNLALLFDRGSLRLLDRPEQTGEITAYQYDVSPTGLIRMNAPEGMHDDCVIALALAAWRRVNLGGKMVQFIRRHKWNY